jgi:hypothetical protein
VILNSNIQMPFYLGLPAQLQVVMVAAALALRQIESPPPVAAEPRAPGGRIR